MTHPLRLLGPATGLAARLGRYAAAGLLALCFGAHAAERESSWWQRVAGGSVAGSGTIKTESRNVSGFQAIVLGMPAKLVLRQGSKEGIELRADDNLLALFETRVVDRAGVPTLEIRTRDGASYSTRTQPVVTVDLIKLGALAVAGSGDVSADALKTPALKVSISGSGDIRVGKLEIDNVLEVKVTGAGDIRFGGRAGKVGVAISGSGNVDTGGLEADDVEVSIAGSGDANVYARKTLAVSIAGSGDVTYSGAATPKTSIAGSGTVKKK